MVSSQITVAAGGLAATKLSRWWLGFKQALYAYDGAGPGRGLRKFLVLLDCIARVIDSYIVERLLNLLDKPPGIELAGRHLSL